MPADTALIGPIRMTASWETWDLPRKSWADGPPDTVGEVAVWCEPDGTPITDEDRIAGLDAKHAQGQKGRVTPSE